MLFFEDIQADYESAVGDYLVSTDEIIEFATRWDPQPFHVDPAAAKASVFGGLVASSLHLFAICTRLFYDHEDRIQVAAMLGKDEIRLPNPARADEVVDYRTRCVDRRQPKSRSDVGIITLADTLSDPRGRPVLTQQVTLMVRCRVPGRE